MDFDLYFKSQRPPHSGLFIGRLMTGFYTYIHTRTDDGKVFYVGKGKGGRAKSLRSRNQHWHRTVEKHGITVDIVAHWELEDEAFEHEKLLISCFRDMGHPLCNQTGGGDGVSGYRHSAETRARLSSMQVGKTVSAAHRAKISAAGIGRIQSERTREKIGAGNRGRKHTDEQRRVNSESHKGQVLSAEGKAKLIAANTGRVVSETTREKLRLASVGKSPSEATRKKIGTANTGRVRSADARGRIAASLTGRRRSPETIAKISASHKARHAAKIIKENAW